MTKHITDSFDAQVSVFDDGEIRTKPRPRTKGVFFGSWFDFMIIHPLLYERLTTVSSGSAFHAFMKLIELLPQQSAYVVTTQAELATLLGVKKPNLNVSLKELERAQLIRCMKGRIYVSPLCVWKGDTHSLNEELEFEIINQFIESEES